MAISVLLGLILNILLPTIVLAEVLNTGNFEHLSIDQGLSNEQVTSIFQDSKGYMWILSSNGIIKYSLKDESINLSKKDIRQNNSITSNVVSCFY